MGLNTIAEVEKFVKAAHKGQTDQLGRDYFEHHLRPIADKLIDHGTHAEMAGLLHDVIEDTDVTATQLRELGVPQEVVQAVEAVTKRDGEPYEGLIKRSAADPLGCLVKLADNALNLESNPALAAVDPDKACRLLAKYQAARKVLLEAQAART